VGIHSGGRAHRDDLDSGLFAGGDIVTGAATVILAMGAGRRAAQGMLEYMGLAEPRAAEPAPAEFTNMHLPVRSATAFSMRTKSAARRCATPGAARAA